MRLPRTTSLVVGLLALALTSARADLVSRYTMDSGFDDSGPGGNDGVFVGPAAPLFEPGADDTVDGAVVLNGVDEYIELTALDRLPVNSLPAYSIAMWVRGLPQNDRRVFSESSSLEGTTLFNIGTDNTGATGAVDVFIRNAAGTQLVPHAHSSGIAFDDTWHHIAWVDDNGAAVLYIDGLRDATDFTYAREALEVDITTIGGILRPLNDPPYSYIFQGAIDDVRIYDHALTEEEVLALVPDAGCPVDGDTHCDDLQVIGPGGSEPGLYSLSVLGAADDSGDPVLYTFRAESDDGTVLSKGPSLDSFADFTLAEGTWTIDVLADDNPNCPDEAGDAVCSTQIVVACPQDGDTHCDDLVIAGPDDDAPGVYEIAVLGASDDSADFFTYTFTATEAGGERIQVGPQDIEITQMLLRPGTWTISVLVDDSTVCPDEADDAICSQEITVVAPEPVLVSHWPFDGDTDDAVGANDGIFWGDVEPFYVEGYDETPAGAIEFDGIDDYVEVLHDEGLPLIANSAFTVAMWVRGLPQNDMRVWSEGNTLTNTPLYNIGTDNTGATGAVDLYVRDQGGAAGAPHLHSAREAFDGEWHHIAMVDDGGVSVLYIDGVRDATDFSYTRSQIPTDTTSIGGILRAAPSHWFTGAIDDVRAYNYALSEAEILELVPEPEDCPADGDSQCDDLVVDGPEGDAPGLWLMSVLGASDDSGDPLLYTFVVTNEAEGIRYQSGPAVDNFAEFDLFGGTWSVSVTVDDSILCRDTSEDAICATTFEVIKPPEILLSHWTFDGHVDDEGEAGNDGTFVGEAIPPFIEDRSGNPESALAFDGVDDYVVAFRSEGLPVFDRRAFTIAMWVNGPPQQQDRRIWSEGSTTNNTPLFNLGTHNTAADGTLDFFLRSSAATVTNHAHSTATVFDNTWHHIAWVDVDGDVTLYVDGEPDLTDFDYIRPAPADMVLDTTSIGGILRAAPSHWFAGSIDDVRVYTYGLSQEDVASIIDGGGSEGPVFHRGDADSSGVLNITDGVFILNFLFLGGETPGCMEAADADDSGALNITDGVYLLNFLFLGGPPPAPPGPPTEPCGEDPEGSPDLGCEEYTAC